MIQTDRKFRKQIGNWILSTLSRDVYERLVTHLEYVDLPQGMIICLPDDIIDYVYFPYSGMVSLVSITENGETVEVGLVGNEGMIGLPVILGEDTNPYQAGVQVSGDGMRLKADIIKAEFNQNDVLQRLLLRYTYVIMAQLSQSAVCNRFHTMVERLSKWLLTTRDRVMSDEFRLTQEDLSSMMGAHRPNVSIAARILLDAGVIMYKRGQISIIDGEGLQAASCECYKIIKTKIDRFLNA